MRHDDNGLVAVPEFFQLSETLVLEVLITHGKNFIYKQHFGIHINGHGKRKPHIHARGIRADWIIDGRTKFGELDDFINPMVDFFSCQAKDRGIEIYVFASGKIRVETGTQFQKARQLSIGLYCPFVGVNNSGHQLQKCGFAASVGTNESYCLAFFNIEADISEHFMDFLSVTAKKEKLLFQSLRFIPADFKIF